VVGTLVIFAIVAFIILWYSCSWKKRKKKATSGKGRNGGGNFYLEASLFDKIRNKYEELAQNTSAKKIIKERQKYT
jgi:hypothetical protein